MPAMFGPVSSQMRPASRSGCGGDRSQSLATNGPPSIASACSTTAWRAALDDEVERAVDLRPHIAALDRERRRARWRHRAAASASAAALISSLAAITAAASRSKISSSRPSARSAALAIFASSSPSSVVVKRTWPASVWRWMKVALSGALEQLLAVLRGDVDEIAEHVVVPDLQRAHAGVVGVARLQAAPPPGGIRRAARATRRARRRSPSRTKPPSRLNSGSSSASAAAQLARRAPDRAAAAPPPRRRSRRACSRQRVEPAARRCRGADAVADRGEVARPAAADHQARQRARQVGRDVEKLAGLLAGERRRATNNVDRVEPPRDRCRDRSAARPAAAPAAASPPPSRCGRSPPAASRAARPPSVRVSSRLARVAWSIDERRALRLAHAAATAAAACRAACAPHR